MERGRRFPRLAVAKVANLPASRSAEPIPNCLGYCSIAHRDAEYAFFLLLAGSFGVRASESANIRLKGEGRTGLTHPAPWQPFCTGPTGALPLSGLEAGPMRCFRACKKLSRQSEASHARIIGWPPAPQWASAANAPARGTVDISTVASNLFIATRPQIFGHAGFACNTCSLAELQRKHMVPGITFLHSNRT